MAIAPETSEDERYSGSEFKLSSLDDDEIVPELKKGKTEIQDHRQDKDDAYTRLTRRESWSTYTKIPNPFHYSETNPPRFLDKDDRTFLSIEQGNFWPNARRFGIADLDKISKVDMSWAFDEKETKINSPGRKKVIFPEIRTRSSLDLHPLNLQPYCIPRFFQAVQSKSLHDSQSGASFTESQSQRRKGLIVALHGFTSCPQAFFENAAQWITEGFDVVLPLLPGHGFAFGHVETWGRKEDLTIEEERNALLGTSLLPKSHHTYFKFAEYLVNKIERERIQKGYKEIIFVGTSFGASMGNLLLHLSRSMELFDRALYLAPFFEIPPGHKNYRKGRNPNDKKTKKIYDNQKQNNHRKNKNEASTPTKKNDDNNNKDDLHPTTTTTKMQLVKEEEESKKEEEEEEDYQSSNSMSHSNSKGLHDRWLEQLQESSGGENDGGFKSPALHYEVNSLSSHRENIDNDGGDDLLNSDSPRFRRRRVKQGGEHQQQKQLRGDTQKTFSSNENHKPSSQQSSSSSSLSSWIRPSLTPDVNGIVSSLTPDVNGIVSSLTPDVNGIVSSLTPDVNGIISSANGIVSSAVKSCVTGSLGCISNDLAELANDQPEYRKQKLLLHTLANVPYADVALQRIKRFKKYSVMDWGPKCRMKGQRGRDGYCLFHTSRLAGMRDTVLKIMEILELHGSFQEKKPPMQQEKKPIVQTVIVENDYSTSNRATLKAMLLYDPQLSVWKMNKDQRRSPLVFKGETVFLHNNKRRGGGGSKSSNSGVSSACVVDATVPHTMVNSADMTPPFKMFWKSRLERLINAFVENGKYFALSDGLHKDESRRKGRIQVTSPRMMEETSETSTSEKMHRLRPKRRYVTTIDDQQLPFCKGFYATD
eukprot:g2009.t1